MHRFPPTVVRLSWLLTVCVACAADTDVDAPSGGSGAGWNHVGGVGGELEGQSGTEVPDGCVEVSRAVVDDLAEPGSGFSFSVDELLDQVAGPWTGELGAPSSASVSFSVELAPGPVYAVTTEWRSLGDTGPGTGDGSGPLGGGGAEPPCEPFYELPLAIAVSAAPILDETFAAVGSSPGIDQLDFRGTVAPDSVVGTTRPTFDPDDYDSYELGVFGSLAGASAQGAVVWRGINGPATAPPPQETCELAGGTGCVDPTTGQCGACTGTTGPPSVVEFVGYFSAHN